ATAAVRNGATGCWIRARRTTHLHGTDCCRESCARGAAAAPLAQRRSRCQLECRRTLRIVPAAGGTPQPAGRYFERWRTTDAHRSAYAHGQPFFVAAR